MSVAASRTRNDWRIYVTSDEILNIIVSFQVPVSSLRFPVSRSQIVGPLRLWQLETGNWHSVPNHVGCDVAHGLCPYDSDRWSDGRTVQCPITQTTEGMRCCKKSARSRAADRSGVFMSRSPTGCSNGATAPSIEKNTGGFYQHAFASYV